MAHPGETSGKHEAIDSEPTHNNMAVLKAEDLLEVGYRLYDGVAAQRVSLQSKAATLARIVAFFAGSGAIGAFLGADRTEGPLVWSLLVLTVLLILASGFSLWHLLRALETREYGGLPELLEEPSAYLGKQAATFYQERATKLFTAVTRNRTVNEVVGRDVQKGSTAAKVAFVLFVLVVLAAVLAAVLQSKT